MDYGNSDFAELLTLALFSGGVVAILLRLLDLDPFRTFGGLRDWTLKRTGWQWVRGVTIWHVLLALVLFAAVNRLIIGVLGL